MNQELLLTIAIPSYQNFKQLVDTLITLTRYVDFPYKIVVVNNSARVDSDGVDFEKRLREIVTYPALSVIHAEKNLGWQGAVNLAFHEQCDTPFFCMMNDDILFLPWDGTFFRHLFSYFKWPEVGAVGPSTNFVMGSQNLWRHDLPSAFSTTLLIGFLMVVRSEAFSIVGGLDEGLPGGDDLDLSILLRKEGYKLIVDRSCYVHHIGAQTGPRVMVNGWNSPEHIDVTNNLLIRKHGVKWWYETVQSKVEVFAPATCDNTEGIMIQDWVKDLKVGLDVGCGANKTVEHAVGVDKDDGSKLGLAGGRKGTRSVANLVADVTSIPLEDESQDFIVARHVFEHLIDPWAALREWRRLLKPGGTLAIACPDEERFKTIVMDWTHVHAYTRATLQQLLELEGFRVEETLQINPGLSFVMRAVKV